MPKSLLRPQRDHVDLIQFVDSVATSYADRGYDMTLRQIEA